MNIELEILKAIVEMVKMGGTYAIIGVIAYFLMQILKLIVIWGFIWVSIRLVVNGVLAYMDKRLNSKITSFQAFSDKASGHLMEALDHFSKENQDILKSQTGILTGLEKQFSDLSEKLNQKTKKTASQKN